ncbi:fatty acid desaturase [Microbispora sp. NPDC049125]|uniref:fatty acid desaturase family protein n=1 Tax=Microbispora sp. NPDC049125 TaxID=3154929 RepID=UPI0034664D65
MSTEAQTITISPTGTHEDLTERIRRAGLLAPRRDYYVLKITTTLLLMAGCWVAFFLIGDSWWQLVVAVALGLTFVQSGFIGHDVGHRQISHTKQLAQAIGWVHMNVLMGMTYGWWVNHHNRHHSHPNNLDKDPDTRRRKVIFHVDEVPTKGATAFGRFVIRHQAVMFFVLLAQEAWRVHASGFQAARAGTLKRPLTELGLTVLHGLLYLGAVLAVLPPVKAIVFILLNQAIFGFYLGAVFAPNHKGMVVHRSDVELDWLHRQVLTSRNIRPGRITDFLFGGLNYQIEHHLYPTMPRVNLGRARPIVRTYCAEHGIPYVEVSAWESYRQVAGFLNEVGAEATAR